MLNEPVSSKLWPIPSNICCAADIKKLVDDKVTTNNHSSFGFLALNQFSFLQIFLLGLIILLTHISREFLICKVVNGFEVCFRFCDRDS